MLSDTTIIVINIASIAFLIILLTILIAATRMRGGAGWAALIIVATTVPVYLSNLMQYMAMGNYLPYLYPGIFFNVLLMPLLWFFTRSQLDKSFRLTARSLLHIIPAFVSLVSHVIYYAPLSVEQLEAERALIFDNSGRNLPLLINDIILYGQVFIYYPAIFLYIRRRKKYLQDNFSDSDYLRIEWVPRFLVVSFILFVTVFVGYIIDPHTVMWLIPILNVIVMGYLAYCIIFQSTAAYINRFPDVSEQRNENKTSLSVMSEGQMKEICERVAEYLQSSKAYINPDLSINMLSSETGIHHRNISIAINGFLHRNFFDLVNEMRVGEAKRLLFSLEDNYTIESVYPECGFRSRSAFFAAFRKFAGTTPTQWLKNNV